MKIRFSSNWNLKSETSETPIQIFFIVWKNNWRNTWQAGLQNGIFATWAMRERKQCFGAQKVMFYDSQSVGLSLTTDYTDFHRLFLFYSRDAPWCVSENKRCGCVPDAARYVPTKALWLSVSVSWIYPSAGKFINLCQSVRICGKAKQTKLLTN